VKEVALAANRDADNRPRPMRAATTCREQVSHVLINHLSNSGSLRGLFDFL